MSDLLNRIEQTLEKCTMTGGSLELDCEELLRDCLDALQAKEESLDKANTQIERMRERDFPFFYEPEKTGVVHELKCWERYYRNVIDGYKTFEIRKDDRGYKVGDVLLLQETKGESGSYTGRESFWLVTYLTDFQQESGYVVMAIKPIPPPTDKGERL